MSSYGQYIRHLGHDWYKIGWTVDYRYPTSRLRFPRGFERNTDEAGAKRFARRHGLELPVNPRIPALEASNE